LQRDCVSVRKHPCRIDTAADSRRHEDDEFRHLNLPKREQVVTLLYLKGHRLKASTYRLVIDACDGLRLHRLANGYATRHAAHVESRCIDSRDDTKRVDGTFITNLR